ncbi:hypothetical protein MCOR03_000293 [Pyricularia oryzae]|nr:hypothetical protein MCOR09_010050 [Pyricularia oryzae]KAI6568895.1 hypothetical protein MCOR03_000293 [Pyricularia oryzae]
MRYIFFAIVAFSASLASPVPGKQDDKLNAKFNGCEVGIMKRGFLGIPKELLFTQCIKRDTPTPIQIPDAPGIKVQCGYYCACDLTQDSADFPKGSKLDLYIEQNHCNV